MDFNQGDQVVHPSYGLGKVITVEEMNFSGNKPRLFYRVDFINSTVWVPVNVPNPRSLRPVTSRRALSRYRRILKSSATPLDDDFRKRQQQLEERSGVGTFHSLCELVRDLHARDHKKPLNGFDLNLLRQARQSLQQEWAAVCGISEAEASHEVEALLNIGVQNGAKE
jgi:RNA polymerase-interacting CarD/CdnL/TRCF family regulator